LAFGTALLIPALASAQTVFTYEPTDLHTIVITGNGSAKIGVGTTVTIVVNPDVQPERVPTRTFILKFRPPTDADPRIIQASVDNRVVDLNVRGSNPDGEMEATVEVPITAGDTPELKMDWTTRDSGNVEMTLKPTLPDDTQNLHTQAKGAILRNVCSISSAKRTNSVRRTVFFKHSAIA